MLQKQNHLGTIPKGGNRKRYKSKGVGTISRWYHTRGKGKGGRGKGERYKIKAVGTIPNQNNAPVLGEARGG